MSGGLWTPVQVSGSPAFPNLRPAALPALFSSTWLTGSMARPCYVFSRACSLQG